MLIIPIFGKEPDQIEERIRLFHALGCEIYQDGNGQLYAVIQKRPDWLSRPDLLIHEMSHLPAQWMLVEWNQVPTH